MIRLTCREVIMRLADYLEAALDRLTRLRVSLHLWRCAECRAYLATYRRTIALAGRSGRVEAPMEVRHRVTQALLERWRRRD
jgi:hypothetical protein